MKIRAELVVHSLREQCFRPDTDGLSVESLDGADVPLEQGSCLLEGEIPLHIEVKISLRMGKDRLVSHVKKPLYLILWNDVADF